MNGEQNRKILLIFSLDLFAFVILQLPRSWRCLGIRCYVQFCLKDAYNVFACMRCVYGLSSVCGVYTRQIHSLEFSMRKWETNVIHSSVFPLFFVPLLLLDVRDGSVFTIKSIKQTVMSGKWTLLSSHVFFSSLLSFPPYILMVWSAYFSALTSRLHRCIKMISINIELLWFSDQK